MKRLLSGTFLALLLSHALSLHLLAHTCTHGPSVTVLVCTLPWSVHFADRLLLYQAMCSLKSRLVLLLMFVSDAYADTRACTHEEKM